MKATEQYFLCVVVYYTLQGGSNFESVDEILAESAAIQMKVIAQNDLVVLSKCCKRMVLHLLLCQTRTKCVTFQMKAYEQQFPISVQLNCGQSMESCVVN